MKWWSYLWLIIAKTASRNFAFKASKIGESVFAGQYEILKREVATVDVTTDEEALDDLGRNGCGFYTSF